MEREQIIDAVRNFLDGDDWHYQFDAEDQEITAGIRLKSKIRNGKLRIIFKDDSYTVYLYSPVSGDESNLTEISKYLAMANYGLLNGNFELDFRDGEIRYKTFVNCSGLESLPKEIIRDSILVGCAMMDRYGNGIAALSLGFSDADTAIKEAENPDGGDN